MSKMIDGSVKNRNLLRFMVTYVTIKVVEFLCTRTVCSLEKSEKVTTSTRYNRANGYFNGKNMNSFVG